MSLKVNYKFVPEYKSAEEKFKNDIISYAGKLLELVGTHTLIVTVDENDVPVIYELNSRMRDALDVDYETY